MNPAKGSTADFWWRQAPGDEEFRALRAAIDDRDRRPTVFLQGRAVDWVSGALDGPGALPGLLDQVDWWVCIGSWRRRSPSGRADDLPPPFQAASLARWLDRMIARRAQEARGAVGHDLVFMIDRGPVDSRDRIETLEPILAAAALECEVAVLVQGEGRRHLAGPGAEAWDQLTDFDLATVFFLEEAADAVPIPERGRPIDVERAARLRDEAGTIARL